MTDPYKRLALRLDRLPNGFPPADDGAELRLLEWLFSPTEASLAAELTPELETPETIAQRLNQRGGAFEAYELSGVLRSMARKGLVKAGRCQTGLGYALKEMQRSSPPG